MKTSKSYLQLDHRIPVFSGAAATLWQSDEYADKAEELLAFQEKLSEGQDRFLQISVEFDSETLFCFVGDLVIGSKC